MATSDVSPQLLEKYLQNRCTDSEKEMVETWYASLNGERNYLDKLNALDREKIRRETLELIKNRINKSESTQVSKQFTWRLVFGIAASLLLIAGFFVQHQYKQNAPIAKTATKEITHPFRLIQFVNNEPRIVMHSLPDGSTVWMHSEASITYPEQFEDNKRLVTFQGEGFFDVKKDKSRPFSIQSGEMVMQFCR
jgi:transmembrane sensor